MIELTESDDIDPELFGLLHSISLEAEPTPSVTYLTSNRGTKTNMLQNQTISIQLPNSMPRRTNNEDSMRVAVTERLTVMRDKMGDAGFSKAAEGKLSVT